MTKEAFKNNILPLKYSLYRFALRMLNDSQEAEDVVQEVFIKLWKQRKTLHQYKNIGGFAMTINKNMCYDKLRLKKHTVDSTESLQSESSTNDAEKKLENEQIMQHIETVVKDLPEQQKMIFQLRDIEGYDYEAIAEILAMSVNTVRVNLSRARQRIREQLQKTYSYGY